MTAEPWRGRPISMRLPRVRRTSLLSTLEALFDSDGPQLGLISAPAGFGKTTLCAQFVDEATAAVAWVDLESTGHTPREMWRAVLSALRSSTQAAEASVRRWPSTPRQPDGRFVQRLQEALTELPDPTVLVLDDVQSVADSAAAQLAVFTRRLPTPLRVVLSSRHDPAFSLHELRLAGQLIEVRAVDLAFTPDETLELLADKRLDADDVTAVTSLTEGWPAGVQLARAMLKQAGDGARLAGLFAAQSSVLADYLFNEAFTCQTDESQDLLLRTSVVPTVTESLAVELTGRSDAGEAITEMVDLAPLLTMRQASDGDEIAYRYHPLLRAYLLGELTRRDRTLLRTTHRLAAVWYEHHDDYLAAIAQARASEDGELIDGYLRRYGPGLILIGESDALLSALSDPRLAPRPWEAAIGASAAIRCADPKTAATWLMHPHVRGDTEEPRLAELRSSVAIKLAGLGDRPDAINGAGAETLATGADDDLDLLIALNRCTTLLGLADEALLERELKDALNLAVSLGRDIPELQCRALDAAVAIGRGDFVEASTRVESALSRSAALQRDDDPAKGLLRVVSAWVAYEQLDDAGARAHLDAWRVDPGAGMDPSNRSHADRYAELLQEILHPGSMEPTSVGPATLTDRTKRLPTSLRVLVCFELVRTALGVGRPDRLREAIEWAATLLGPCGDIATMQAMILTAQGRSDVARTRLRPVVEEETSCLDESSLVAALTMSAAYAIGTHDAYDAVEYLKRALATARALGRYRPLVQAPTIVHELMGDQSERLASLRDVADRVLAYVQQPESRPRLVSPLTPREFDILRELPTLNRVEEIALDLLVSTNTVKTHIRGIYRKLGVNSRKAAVAEARRLGLL